MTLGDNIRKYRNRAQYTQEELASRANISRSYLADIENNRYNPSLDVLSSIAQSLNIELAQLLGSTLKPDTVRFTTAEEVMEFVLNQKPIIDICKLNIDDMNRLEREQFILDILDQIELVSYKYRT